MALDVTVEALEQPLSAQDIVKSLKANLKVPEGFTSEHIHISGDGTDSSDKPTVVGNQFTLANRVRGLRTEFTFFDEGFVKIREYKRKKLLQAYMLELRFLNPKPTVIRRFVMQSLWTALGSGGVAAICWLIAKWTTLDAYLLPASIVFATGAIVALLLFIYQSGEKVMFCTASGKVPVLTLLASFSCLRRYRSTMPEVSRAVGDAILRNTLEEEPYLRAEMQDHYRLRNGGVITAKACSTGTARILARFG